jgi:hypothetical protein
MAEADAAHYVEQFAAAGIVAYGEDGRFHYQPASAQIAQHVRALAQAYRERPVTLFRIIYALRDTKIQSFADAFKLRRK